MSERETFLFPEYKFGLSIDNSIVSNVVHYSYIYSELLFWNRLYRSWISDQAPIIESNPIR